MTVLGSLSGGSLADVIVIPMTRVNPTDGETTNPAGMASLAKSRFRYFAWVLSIALATPSEPGLLDEEAITGSPGWVTSLCALILLLRTRQTSGTRMMGRRLFIKIALAEVCSAGCSGRWKVV